MPDLVKKIQSAIHARFDSKYYIDNAFVFYWECDSFIVTKSNYGVEFEIKLSRSDFRADFKKITKHQTMKSGEGWVPGWHTWDLTKMNRPNKFYYVCPVGMIAPEEIPTYAGLVYFTDTYPPNAYGCANDLKIIKKAPLIHQTKTDYEKILCSKYYHLWLNEKANRSQR